MEFLTSALPSNLGPKAFTRIQVLIKFNYIKNKTKIFKYSSQPWFQIHWEDRLTRPFVTNPNDPHQMQFVSCMVDATPFYLPHYEYGTHEWKVFWADHYKAHCWKFLGPFSQTSFTLEL